MHIDASSAENQAKFQLQEKVNKFSTIRIDSID